MTKERRRAKGCLTLPGPNNRAEGGVRSSRVRAVITLTGRAVLLFLFTVLYRVYALELLRLIGVSRNAYAQKRT